MRVDSRSLIFELLKQAENIQLALWIMVYLFIIRSYSYLLNVVAGCYILHGKAIQKWHGHL